MLFRGDDVDKLVGSLSGGERARLRLAQLLLDQPNVLLLDEPTNHLDIPSCEALESALNHYPGTVFCVSHDRFFLDKFAQRLFVLDPPGLRDFSGNYTQWAHRAKAVEAAAPPAKTAPRRERQPLSASVRQADSGRTGTADHRHRNRAGRVPAAIRRLRNGEKSFARPKTPEAVQITI
jgi:ATP-binding cassette subfamily F protein 3